MRLFIKNRNAVIASKFDAKASLLKESASFPRAHLGKTASLPTFHTVWSHYNCYLLFSLILFFLSNRKHGIYLSPASAPSGGTSAAVMGTACQGMTSA